MDEDVSTRKKMLWFESSPSLTSVNYCRLLPVLSMEHERN